MNHNELADRIEALDGPCREMDAEIAVAIDLTIKGMGITVAEYAAHWPENLSSELDNPTSMLSHLPKFTASTDAAMTLATSNHHPSDIIISAVDRLNIAVRRGVVDRKNWINAFPRFLAATALRAEGAK